jgi:hypothetical protein
MLSKVQFTFKVNSIHFKALKLKFKCVIDIVYWDLSVVFHASFLEAGVLLCKCI